MRATTRKLPLPLILLGFPAFPLLNSAITVSNQTRFYLAKTGMGKSGLRQYWLKHTPNCSLAAE